MGYFFIGGVFLMEGSSVILHLRRILKGFGFEKTRLYDGIGILLLIVYFIFRVCNLPYLVNVYYTEANPNLNKTSKYQFSIHGVPCEREIGVSVSSNLPYSVNVYYTQANSNLKKTPKYKFSIHGVP
eukprot:Pgem_evm1s3586